MFQVNDYVVHGSNGVCKVVEISTPDIHGIDKSKLYYKLRPENTKGSIIYTPVDNEKQNMRSIITKEEALRLIEDIPKMDIIQESDDKLTEYKYRETMKKYSCSEWIKIIKSLYLENKKRMQEGKKIGNTYLKYYNDAQEYLYSELSIPLEIPKDEIEDCITDRLQTL